MGKKPRSDSKLDALLQERRLELRDGLLAGWKYAEAIMDGADASQFDVAAILKLKEMAFEMMLTEDAEPEVIEKIMRLVLKSQSQDHDARKLRIIEQKAKRADKVEELIMQRKDAGGGITEDFLATIEKALKM